MESAAPFDTSASMVPTGFRLLTRQQWQQAAEAHRAQASCYTEPYVQRRHRGLKHPVEDFLFTYYTLKPAQLKRWHPGAGTIVLNCPQLVEQKFYRAASTEELEAAGLSPREARETGAAGTAAVVDTAAFYERRAETVNYVRQLLHNTVQKPGFFGCFGMHEWAMAYRSEENSIRHDYLTLRLGAAGTDEVVDRHRLRCSHFDAFRFFMPQAAPLNELQPTREKQPNLEQPACLHANMDVYKWSYKLLPLVDSQLLLDSFELAWQVRELDMRVAPYDLTGWGYEPICVETPEGKAEYVKRQRAFAQRSTVLRRRLLEVLENL